MASKKVIKKVADKKVAAGDVRKYEMLAIYPLSVNEIAAEKSLADMAKKNGFSISEVDKWGVKNLAYAIKKETKGYYLRFMIENGETNGLEKDLSFDDKILRYIIVRI
mgnify:FL=1|jgi:small subunit ribosomal protein S6